MEFKEIELKDLYFEANKSFNNGWGVLAATNKEGKTNCLTISWGTYGELWNKPILIAFVRPERYTHQFIGDSEYFSINFFDDKYKKDLSYLGTHSGKDEDKVAHVGFHYLKNKYTSYFEEANLVFILKKLYEDDFKRENFIDKSIVSDIYRGENKLHSFYIGEVIKVLKK